VALPTDVRRSSPTVKTAFETVFLAMVALLEQSVPGQGRVRREKAQGIAALCVGGLTVSRALRDVGLADKLREACMAVALRLMDSNELQGAKAEDAPKRRRAYGRADPLT
jgi:hypothetical protein